MDGHMDGSSADFALRMDWSHADYAQHMERTHSFRYKIIAQIKIFASFQKYIIGVYIMYVTTFQNESILRESTNKIPQPRNTSV